MVRRDQKKNKNNEANSCCLSEASFRDFRILFLILAEESEVLIFGSFHQGKEHYSYYPFIIIKK